MDYPTVAASPEAAQLGAAQGLLVNAITEYNYRCTNLHRVHGDEQRAAEESFLEGWSQRLDAEQARLTLWARDLQSRQITAGTLIPQPDGSFTVRPPTDPKTVAKRAAWAAAATLALLALATGQLAGLLALGGMIAVGWLIIRALIQKGNPRVAAGTQQNVGDATLIAARAEAQRQADLEAQAAVDRAREQECEAAARRAEALERARQRAAQSDDRWD